VISSDSLIIGQSPVVRFILNFFTLFSAGKNNIVKAELIYGYFNYLYPLISGVEEFPAQGEQFHAWFEANQEIPEIFKPWISSPGSEVKERSPLSLPLFELASRIAHDFGLNKIKGELVYLEAFLDLVLQYGRDEAGGISGFLDWWKTTGDTKTISLSEGQNAISILTIHKAKGLEFHTVIVPFCDWEIVPQGTKAPYLWCHPVEAPFDQMDLVLVRYGSGLQQTLFSDAYFNEMLYSAVDNLNLLYVAFTRAVNSLIVFCPYSPKLNNPYRSISSLIQGVIEDTKTFETGTPRKVLYSAQSQVSVNNELNQLILARRSDRLKLRIHSDAYFDLYDSRKAARIGHGKLMHELFEKIATVPEVSASIKRVLSEGKIDTRTAREYEQLIYKVLENEPFRSWFSGEWKVLNERDILRGKESRHRPDRVMIKGDELIVIDYKTGEKSDSHHAQVRGYLRDFVKMGYLNPKGYLWYLSENELVEIS